MVSKDTKNSVPLLSSVLHCSEGESVQLRDDEDGPHRVQRPDSRGLHFPVWAFQQIFNALLCSDLALDIQNKFQDQ